MPTVHILFLCANETVQSRQKQEECVCVCECDSEEGSWLGLTVLSECLSQFKAFSQRVRLSPSTLPPSDSADQLTNDLPLRIMGRRICTGLCNEAEGNSKRKTEREGLAVRGGERKI